MINFFLQLRLDVNDFNHQDSNSQRERTSCILPM